MDKSNPYKPTQHSGKDAFHAERGFDWERLFGMTIIVVLSLISLMFLLTMVLHLLSGVAKWIFGAFLALADVPS